MGIYFDEPSPEAVVGVTRPLETGDYWELIGQMPPSERLFGLIKWKSSSTVGPYFLYQAPWIQSEERFHGFVDHHISSEEMTLRARSADEFAKWRLQKRPDDENPMGFLRYYRQQRRHDVVTAEDLRVGMEFYAMNTPAVYKIKEIRRGAVYFTYLRGGEAGPRSRDFE